MFPALIDYTGEQSVSWHCPTGLYEVSHHHRFWHNATAALISWLVIVNVYQPSQVEWRCVKPTPETQETRSTTGVQDS